MQKQWVRWCACHVIASYISLWPIAVGVALQFRAGIPYGLFFSWKFALAPLSAPVLLFLIITMAVLRHPPTPSVLQLLGAWLAYLLPFGGAYYLLLHRRIRAAQRLRNAECVKCGYDLRATPDRCPECGTIPANSKT